MKYDIHNVKDKFANIMVRLEKNKELLPANKKRIFEFERYAVSIGLKEARRLKYIGLLRWLSKELGKPFENATREDLEKIVGGVEKSDLTEWSKVDRKVTIKRFYKWLKCNDEEYPKVRQS